MKGLWICGFGGRGFEPTTSPEKEMLNQTNFSYTPTWKWSERAKSVLDLWRAIERTPVWA